MNLHDNQKGIGAVFLICGFVIVLAVVGFFGYRIYKAGNNKQLTPPASQHTTSAMTQDFIGIVQKANCDQAGVGCTEYILQIQDAKSYNLIGSDLVNYVNKTVKVQGTLNQEYPPGTIVVTAIELANNGTEAVNGMLKGQVYCTQKVNEEPCAADIEVTTIVPPGTSQPSRLYTAKAGSQGNFSLQLEQGSYELRPLPKDGYPVLVPVKNPITISVGKTTEVTIRYMDGTR